MDAPIVYYNRAEYIETVNIYLFLFYFVLPCYTRTQATRFHAHPSFVVARTLSLEARSVYTLAIERPFTLYPSVDYYTNRMRYSW